MNINDRIGQIDQQLHDLEIKEHTSEDDYKNALQNVGALLHEVDPDQFDVTQMLRIQLIMNRLTDLSKKTDENSIIQKALKEMKKMTTRDF